jgi:RNA polymerase sigma-70 factor (ECF subfamily)
MAEQLLEHESLICSLAYRLTGSCDECSDIVQETYLRTLREFNRGTEILNPRAWMSRVAVNLAISRIRQRSRLKSLDGLPEEAAGVQEATDETVSGEGFNPVLEKAILKLPERERMAILLRYQSDLSLEEIASTLGLSVPAVKSLMFRAREKLRKRLRRMERE